MRVFGGVMNGGAEDAETGRKQCVRRDAFEAIRGIRCLI